ncbi:MAG: hypothetical protein AAF730_04150 [Bacteroidota bacterium]
MIKRPNLACLLVWLGLWMGSLGAHATPVDVLREAIAAIDAKQFQAAVQLLEPLVASDPAYRDPDLGAAAYWLGTAYGRQGDADKQERVWTTGLNALYNKGSFDVRLGDAYLHTLFSEDMGAQLTQARAVYLELLNHADRTVADAEDAILAPHVTQLALIMDEMDRNRLLTLSEALGWQIREGMVPELFEWLRRADALPATRQNERLDEHLQRVGYALSRYSRPDVPSHLDARGETWVRYGEPYSLKTLTYDEPRLTDLLFSPGGPAITYAELPAAEFWIYAHIDRAAYFIFVEDRDEYYRQGDTEDLIPRGLRQGFSRSERGIRKAQITIALMRYVFRELAILHPDFESRYNEVETYASIAEDDLRPQGYAPPGVFARRSVVQTAAQDQQMMRDRALYVPETYTETLGDFGPLDVASRVVRFLDPNGTTRTEVFWAPEPGSMLLPRRERRRLREMDVDLSRYYMVATAIQKNLDYTDRVVSHNRFFAVDLPVNSSMTLPVQQLTARGDTSRYHLALQWNQHLIRDLERQEVGDAIKMGSARYDDLNALSNDPTVLEMSDLLPLFSLDADGFIGASGEVQGQPYPFGTLTNEMPMALTFEVYHLTYGSDDATRYQVEYEIERAADDSRLRLRGADEGRTSVQTAYTGTSRTAKESIFVDLSQWSGRGDLIITVRVTDLNSNQQVERSVAFELLAEDN